MRSSDFDYALPRERIAQEPLPERDASRLLVAGPGPALSDRRFIELPDLLAPGDLLVANRTRVRHARLHGTTQAGRALELLVLEPRGDDRYLCLARPARLATEGTRVDVGEHLTATVVGRAPDHPGGRVVHLGAADVEAAIETAGEVPLPPYIGRGLADPTRYQTVYAAGRAASAAAPTAGLHFTARVLEGLRRRGVGWATLRLDVGLGTFAPMRTGDIEAHPMHSERFELPPATASAIADARRRGGRVVAVGTTVVRVLESRALEDGTVEPGAGSTSLYIRPGYRFRAVDGLLTNFHQPRSTLLVLLAAFLGGERWRAAYEHALRAGYRFLSLGDCMLCWPPAA